VRFLEEFTIQNILIEFNGHGMYIALYCAALIYILLSKKTRDKYLFFYPAVILLFTVFNPFIAPLFMYVGRQDATYYRFFWALPIVILLAYVITQLIKRSDGKRKRTVVCISCAVVIVICGVFIGRNTAFYLPETTYKVPSSLLQLSEFIHGDKEKQGRESDTVMVGPDEIILNMRLYDASLKTPYGRNEIIGLTQVGGEEGIAALLRFFSKREKVSADILAVAIEQSNINYMVLPTDSPYAEILINAGGEFIVQIGEYELYRNLRE
jgi:hypothetical protein